MYGFVYRNYFPAKGPFFVGGDIKGAYDSTQATTWYSRNKQYVQEITIIRPPNNKVKILLPIKEGDDEVDIEFERWVANPKLEPKMGYILDQILESYYFGKDTCFHKRAKKEEKEEERNEGVVFTMREVIEGNFRISPIKIRTSVDKETKKIRFTDRDIGTDVHGVPFIHDGKEYKTNFFGLYGAKFREAIFPESEWNVNGSRLQSRQKDFFIKQGRITIVLAPRGAGKSQFNAAFVAQYLWKELTMDFEFSRPFLLVYGGLSIGANLQVVDYIRGMARKLSTNNNLIKWNNTDKILTLYDGLDERKIKFVSQGQEGQGFTGLRPHKIILDEAARLEKRMFEVAIGTIEAPITLITTVDADSPKNRVYEMYKQAVFQMRSYKDVYELTKETWVKFGMHELKNKSDVIDAINKGVFKKMREYFYSQRPLVGVKYTLDDIDRYTKIEKQGLIDTALQVSEEFCLAEYFSEYVEGRVMFSTEGLVETSIPDRFDLIAIGIDPAEVFDTFGFVVIGWVGGTAYVIKSEKLDASDLTACYKQISEYKKYYKTMANQLIVSYDGTQARSSVREMERYGLEPDYVVYMSSAKHDEIVYSYPYWRLGKLRLIKTAKEEFFSKSAIIFSPQTEEEGGLIEEIGFYRQNENTKKIEGAHKKSDDQVTGMLLALLGIYLHDMKDNNEYQMQDVYETQYEKIMYKRAEIERQREMEDYEKLSAQVIQNFR